MRSLVAVAVVLCLVAVSGSANAATVARPSWTAGDYWTYSSNTTLIPGFYLTGTSTVSVTGTVPAAVGGGTVDAFRAVLSGSGAASGYVNTSSGNFTVRGTWVVTGEERFEPVDLHPIYSLFDLSANGTYGIIIPLPFSLRVQNTTTYAVVSDGWTYPLVPGTSGNVTDEYNFTQDIYSSITGHLNANGTGEANFTYSLGAAVNLTTPAGTFEAFPERQDMPDGAWSVSLFSPTAGNDVETRAYNAQGNLTSVETLTAYRYQALEPSTFLGLTTTQWILVLAVVVAAGVIGTIFLIRRRRRKKSPAPGPSTEGPTSGPRGP